MRDRTYIKSSLSLWGQLKPYVLTIAVVVLTGAFKIFLNKILFINSPLLLFFTAVAVATWLGGLRQGFFAILCVVAFVHFFLKQPSSVGYNAWSATVKYILFAVDCFLVAVVFDAYRRSLRNLKISQQIRQSQYFLDSVIENIPNMIFVKDAKDLKFVSFNRAGEQLTGWKREEIIGKSDLDFFPKDEAEAFRAKDREVLNGKEVVWIPEEILSTKHGIRYLSTKKIPILGPDGVPRYLLGISEDITVSKEVERQKMSLMVEQTARIEAEKTAQRFAFLSRATASLTETLDPELMVKKLAELIVEEMADFCVITVMDNRDHTPLKALAASDEKLKEKVLNFMADYPMNWNLDVGLPHIVRTGESRLFRNYEAEDRSVLFQSSAQAEAEKKIGVKSMILVPVQTYGRIIGVVGLASADPARLYDDLDLSVAEDLARRAFFAIENARLYHNAQEASRAKSSFLANMSHEIRTPLGAMLGFAELLLDSGDTFSPKHRHFLSTIQRNGAQLLKIVDEVLDISKVESERLYIEQVPFFLPNLVEDVSTLLKRQASMKGLDFRVTSEGIGIDRIVSDPTRLRQILINVIGNAIKFTEVGEVAVHLNLQPIERMSSKMTLEISVRDTGIGITPVQAERLFQPFSQADSSMTRRFGGTGLGLFLSRKLARLLGGDLVLRQSEIGVGSEFVLTVLVDRFVGLLKDSNGAEHHNGHDSIKGKVLVVDDSIDNREWLQYACERIGLAIDTAESGKEGVAKALTNSYDAVLMDIQMPGMDGFAAIQSLHSKNYQGIVIAVTAHAMKGDRENCLAKGFNDYLCKPLTRQSLEECLRRHLAAAN